MLLQDDSEERPSSHGSEVGIGFLGSAGPNHGGTTSEVARVGGTVTVAIVMTSVTTTVLAGMVRMVRVCGRATTEDAMTVKVRRIFMASGTCSTGISLTPKQEGADSLFGVWCSISLKDR